MAQKQKQKSKGNPAGRRAANEARKARRSLSWARGRKRKAERQAEGERRRKANDKRRANGEHTPWEAARAARHARRHPES